MQRKNQQSKNPLWNKDYILLLIVNAVAFLSFQILQPLVPVYGLSFSATESQLGFLSASIATAALIMRPVSGSLADRKNNKIIIFLGQLGMSAVIITFIFAPNIGVLILSRFFHGLFFGLSSTVVTVAAVRVMPEEQIGRGVGLISITGLASLAVAPAIGLWISGIWGYPVLFIFTSAISVGAAVLALALTPKAAEPPNTKKSGISKISIKDFIAFEALGLTGLIIIFTGSTGTITNFLVVFANTRGIENIGLYFTIYALVLVGARLLGSGFIDRYSYRLLIPICAALCTCAMGIIGSSHSFPPLCAASAMENVPDNYQAAGLSEDDLMLITQADETYAVRFKLAEWAGGVKNWFMKK